MKFDNINRVRRVIVVVSFVVALLIGLGVALGVSGGKPSGAFAGLVAGLICAGIAYFISVALIGRGFKGKFKREIIAPLVTQIAPELTYRPNIGISSEEFLACGIYRGFDTYSANDLITGMVDGVWLKCSDVNAQKIVTKYDKKGNAKQTHITIFAGTYFVAKFNKKIKSATYVIDRANSQASAVGERAMMDNAEFEKTFATYTGDQINARYILTPKFMQDFLALRRAFGHPMSACFVDDKVHIFLSGTDHFEPNYLRAINSESLQRYRGEILALKNIIKTLNLSDDLFLEE